MSSHPRDGVCRLFAAAPTLRPPLLRPRQGGPFRPCVRIARATGPRRGAPGDGTDDGPRAGPRASACARSADGCVRCDAPAREPPSRCPPGTPPTGARWDGHEHPAARARRRRRAPDHPSRGHVARRRRLQRGQRPGRRGGPPQGRGVEARHRPAGHRDAGHRRLRGHAPPARDAPGPGDPPDGEGLVGRSRARPRPRGGRLPREAVPSGRARRARARRAASRRGRHQRRRHRPGRRPRDRPPAPGRHAWLARPCR